MKWLGMIPPVGSPIRPRLRGAIRQFDWTFGNEYLPIFVDSGTTALRLAITVARSISGATGPVWLPAYGCPDLLSACWAAGGEPSLYDVGPELPFYSGSSLPPRDISAVVVCHFLGLKAPMAAFEKVLAPGTLLIEDSAQHFPTSAEDTFSGDFVVLSFGRGKPVSLLEGGCLLSKTQFAGEVRGALSTWRRSPPDRFAALRRQLHDVAIRPNVYGLITHFPGFRPGQVRYRAAGVPSIASAQFQELAGTAAHAYQSEVAWRLTQQLVQQFVATMGPNVKDLFRAAESSANCRLLRYPILTSDPDHASALVKDLLRRGLCATRMYRDSLPNIPGVPSELSEPGPNAQHFAERCVTIPVSFGDPAL